MSTIIAKNVGACSVRLEVPEATPPEHLEHLSQLMAELLLKLAEGGELRK